jgi:hypothetical protein
MERQIATTCSLRDCWGPDDTGIEGGGLIVKGNNVQAKEWKRRYNQYTARDWQLPKASFSLLFVSSEQQQHEQFQRSEGGHKDSGPGECSSSCTGFMCPCWPLSSSSNLHKHPVSDTWGPGMFKHGTW